ncbi:MAG: N-6 DNA methylase [Bacillota bacterium]|nr:N-6 DNA methylase [Bacillota bacterium]
MKSIKKYGVVYTPNYIADFLIYLLKQEMEKDHYIADSFLDPSCGEGALLLSSYKEFGSAKNYRGIDIDEEAINSLSKRVTNQFKLYCNDTIQPIQGEKSTFDYWKKTFPELSVVIANPPWSSEKVYTRKQLKNLGFEFYSGQYDSYVLFLELAYKILPDEGYFGFIVPDSLFDYQNSALRRFLCEKTQIRVIARLGEKIFNDVNRAATIIVCRKTDPGNNSPTMCFRLTPQQRKYVLADEAELHQIYDAEKHSVRQSRFLENDYCLFDIDTRASEESLIRKIGGDQLNLYQTFNFGRGVEISKKGTLVICPSCEHAQGYSKSQLQIGSKTCVKCGYAINISSDVPVCIISDSKVADDYVRILVGENIRRYEISGSSFIKLGVGGVNYKKSELYQSPKLLVRKTGLGIYVSIDYENTMTSQTVYILKYRDRLNSEPLEYYLALLNSRAVYYFYLKVYGENEWKSHPYLTKEIIFSLPIKKYTKDPLDKEIAKLSKQLCKKYNYNTDLELEKLVFQRYGISDEEAGIIRNEINRMPDLSAINGMKFLEE